MLKVANFNNLRRACILQNSVPSGAHLSTGLVDCIKKTRDVDELVDEIVSAGLWSWIDVSIMDAMAAASSIPDALNLVRKYKTYAFSKYLHEIIPSVPVTTKYLGKVSCKINKSPYSITVEDLVIYKEQLETVILNINRGSLTIADISEGCVEVHYYIPAKMLIHAHHCSLKNRRKFCSLHIRYLYFEGHSKVYSMNCSNPHNTDSFPNIDQQGLYTCVHAHICAVMYV